MYVHILICVIDNAYKHIDQHERNVSVRVWESRIHNHVHRMSREFAELTDDDNERRAFIVIWHRNACFPPQLISFSLLFRWLITSFLCYSLLKKKLFFQSVQLFLLRKILKMFVCWLDCHQNCDGTKPVNMQSIVMPTVFIEWRLQHYLRKNKWQSVISSNKHTKI